MVSGVMSPFKFQRNSMQGKIHQLKLSYNLQQKILNCFNKKKITLCIENIIKNHKTHARYEVT